MELIIEGNRSLILIRIVGSLDASTCRMLRDSLLDLSNSGRNRVRVDLERVAFLDTSGVGVLAGLQNTLRARGGCLEAVNPQPGVRKVLERLGLDRDLLKP